MSSATSEKGLSGTMTGTPSKDVTPHADHGEPGPKLEKGAILGKMTGTPCLEAPKPDDEPIAVDVVADEPPAA